MAISRGQTENTFPEGPQRRGGAVPRTTNSMNEGTITEHEGAILFLEGLPKTLKLVFGVKPVLGAAHI